MARLRAKTFVLFSCAALVWAAPLHAEAPAAPLPRIVAAAAADGEALTLGHVVTVTLCAPKDAKPVLDVTKLGLVIAGFRAAERPATVVAKPGECELAQAKGMAFELGYRVEYTHAKRKEWLTVFEARDDDRKAAVGLADESGKPLVLDAAQPVVTVVLKRMLQWELWLFVGIAGVLVVGLAILILRSNLMRDGGDNLSAKWRDYLDAKHAAWAGAGFAAPSPTLAEMRAALSGAGATAAERDAVVAAVDAARAAAGATRDQIAQAFVTQTAPITARVKAPYSLARLQMALWTIVILAGLWLVYLITATIFQIPGSVLVLMGVSGATYLGARVLDARAPAAPAAPAGPAAAAHPPPRSRDLLTDIVSDERGIALHRAQMAIWTFALIAMFLTELFRRLVFVEFDDTMLGLLGISNGTYLALKALEK
jgi:hypothetical protein